jgi:hypothetical protein
MLGADSFWGTAHAALQNHNIPPGDFMRLSPEERAFIIASDQFAYEQTRRK